MDVDLYVYDLSKGLARMYSQPLTGTQIDAIYHTSIVLDGIEYYFGQGIQTAVPGSTHHGQPIEVVRLGITELPKDVVEEYIQSLEEIYSLESYDLFLHNCNNFTQDLATFLVGQNIPEHIRNLPRTFLNTPFGQMMKPQIESALRGVTQGTGTAGVPQPPPAPAGATRTAATATPGAGAGAGAAVRHGTEPEGTVRIVSNTQQLDQYLAHAAATRKAVVIFFTSATCPPCKMVYAPYDELAEEAGAQAMLLKVDVSTALDVGTRYGVRATPTFMTFLDGGGEKIDEWSGANAGQLRGNVRLLVQMQAGRTQHPHRRLDLPTLQREITSYVLYKKVPPLDKVRRKLGSADEAVISSIITFLQARNNTTSPAKVPVPDTLPAIGTYLQTAPHHLPRANHFAVVDLARLLFLDPRVSGYFSERDPSHNTLLSLFSLASETPPHPPPHPDSHPQIDSSAEPPPEQTQTQTPKEPGPPPSNLRMLLLHLACNLFSTPLYTSTHLRARAASLRAASLRAAVLHLATSSLLDDPPSPTTLRVAAASCLYNFTALNHNVRLANTDVGATREGKGEGEEPLTEEEQVEMAAAMIEALRAERESVETVRGLVVGLGLLVYGAGMDGAVVDVCHAMGAVEVLGEKGREKGFGGVQGVIREVGGLFESTR